MGTAIQVVGIGASAGGLEPLQEFFAEMPADAGFAYVVVQHLSPHHTSLMDELIARHTDMRVRRVEDGVLLETNTVYVLTPKVTVQIDSGRLRVVDQIRHPGRPSNPIDTFFESLAQDCGERGVAIVLSGTGSDGSRGIREVHNAGGRTIAQDETAKFDGMPRAAIETGTIDMILAPKDIPKYLLGEEDEDGVRPTLVDATSSSVIEVLDILRLRHDIDFNEYKITTVLRRIQRRVKMTNCESLDAYIKYLAQHDREQDGLYRDLLIGVTRFFRDPDAFHIMESQIFPEIFQRNSAAGEEVRIWASACASGEEAYSWAMLAHEMNEQYPVPGIRIFATDVHRGSVEFASAGRYEEDLLEDMLPVRRERYFTRRGTAYQVSPVIRSLITFASHNILADAPYTKMDFIACRNLLIYLKPAAQERVLSRLHFALKVDAVLMLGSSETPGRLHREFTTVDPHWRVYRKLRAARLIADTDILPDPARRVRIPYARQMGTSPLLAAVDSRVQAAYDVLLEDLLPAGFLLNERRELVHTFGAGRELLRPPTGKMSLDVVDMVDESIRTPLRAAITASSVEHKPFQFDGLELDLGGGPKSCRIQVKAIEIASDLAPYMLVTFFELPINRKAPQSDTKMMTAEELDSPKLEHIRELERELDYIRASRQATIEEMETTNEELNATNEELIASNEELQSTNEELQSVNEELHTVNAEHQQKIVELMLLTDDINNLLASTDIGTLFLDENICIRKFTPAVVPHFRLRDQDIGRPLVDITTSIDVDVPSRCVEVLRSYESYEMEAIGANGLELLLRWSPYIAQSGTVSGVVMTLVDISRVKEAELAARTQARENQLILDHIPSMVWYKDMESRVVRVNRAAAVATGLPTDAIEGKRTEDLHPENGERYVADDRKVLENGQPMLGIVEPFEGEVNGHPRWLRTDKVPLRTRDGALEGLLVVASDITEAKCAEDEIRDISRRLSLSIKAAKLGVWEIDVRTQYCAFSDTWYTMLGYEPQEFPASFDAWSSLIHDDDRASVLEIYNSYIEGRSSTYELAHRLRGKDGRYRWLRSLGEIAERSPSGEPLKMYGVHVDIDAEHRAADKLRHLNADLSDKVSLGHRELEAALLRFRRCIEGSQAGIWEWYPDSGEHWCSPQFWYALGYDNAPPAASDRKAPFVAYLDPKTRQATEDRMSTTFEKGQPWTERCQLRTADEDFRWFDIKGIATRSSGDDRRVVAGSIMDVHEEELAKTAQEGMRQELEARVLERTTELSGTISTLADRNARLDEFAHVASHDLRAPLRTIAGFVELLQRRERFEGKSAEHADRIMTGVSRMNELLDGLSAYAEVTRSEVESKRVDLRVLLSEVIADVANDIDTSGAELSCDDVHGVIVGDRRLLRQVLLNLIGNALKFAKGRPQVMVRCEDRPQEVILRVEDNGPGIEDSYKKVVFEPLNRGSTSLHIAGSGIGLSVCRSIVERHGGDIWVEDGSSGGAVVAFNLFKPSAMETA